MVDMPPQINMETVFAIESSGNPEAHNKDSDARGKGQITPVVLKEFNMLTGSNVKPHQLFNEGINIKISDWYMNQRIPKLLKEFGLEDNVQNRLISYNFGIGNLGKVSRGEKTLPKETREYLIKYDLGGDVRLGQQRLKEMGFDPGPVDGILGPNTIKAYESFQDSNVQTSPVQRQFGIQPLKR
jgi:hypothetical protein